MPSKFFGNKHDNLSPGSRGKQTKNNVKGGSRGNNKRSSGVKKSGRGR